MNAFDLNAKYEIINDFHTRTQLQFVRGEMKIQSMMKSKLLIKI